MTRQDPPTSLRMNTARASSSTFLKQLVAALPSGRKDQFYERRIKSFNPLHFHSRNIRLLAARFIVCCAGIIEEDKNDGGKNEKNNLCRILEMLHRTRNTSSRTRTCIIQSQ